MDHQSAVDRNLAERYLLGELEAAEAAEFEDHYFDCLACAEEVRLGSRFISNVKAVLREDQATTIEIGPGDRFLDLSIQLVGENSGFVAVECEFLAENADSIVVDARASSGRLRLLVPAELFSAGTRTLVLRDAASGGEIERRRLYISKRS